MALQRIVKMTFKKEHCQAFEAYFDSIKDEVGNQPGCNGVRLLKDITENGVYFTYSYWISEEALNAYRDTPLFNEVWPKVKAWFDAKPEAWSTMIAQASANVKAE